VVIAMHLNRGSISLNPEDQAFFDQFYRDYIGLLYYFANQITGSAANCDDLVQDVVERLIKQVPSLRNIINESGKLAYYIKSATQSAFIDRYRNDRNYTYSSYPPEVLDAIIEDRLAAQRRPFDDSYWDVQLLKQKLPAKDWKLIEGKYMIGYSNEELGQMYGCSKDSVRMALSRVKKKSRAILFDKNAERGESNEH
jgi:RNA polymerase sigma-70 factor (ECF subfamily)